MLEDADGSLLVIDTGGWYKLCCPTSQLVKPDVLGAIYRVRRKGAPKVDDPRGLKLAWAEMSADDLVALLDDPRPAVRRRAVERPGGRRASTPSRRWRRSSAPGVRPRPAGTPSGPRRGSTTPTPARSPATGLDDADETVRQAAIHSVSVWGDRDAAPS